MRVAIVGGTGPFGKALAGRLHQSGLEVVVGSRDAERAAATALELHCVGETNDDASEDADFVILAVNADAALDTARGLRDPIGQTPVLSVARLVPSDTSSTVAAIVIVWQLLRTLRTNLAPLGILLALVGLLAIIGVRYQTQQRDLSRDQLALLMVTLSDTQSIHVPAVAGVPEATHGSYRSRPGTPVAVLALHNFAPAPEGKTYQGWVLYQGNWISLGTANPDANGNAVLIGENAGLAVPPEAVQVTVEPTGGSASPIGPVILSWSSK